MATRSIAYKYVKFKGPRKIFYRRRNEIFYFVGGDYEAMEILGIFDAKDLFADIIYSRFAFVNYIGMKMLEIFDFKHLFGQTTYVLSFHSLHKLWPHKQKTPLITGLFVGDRP